MVHEMNFHSALLSAYLENPCQVLPNAFWKTAAHLDSMQADFVCTGATCTCLEAWDDQRLLVLWTRDRSAVPAAHRHLDDFKLILLHQDYLQQMPVRCLPRRKPFFRLIYTGGQPLSENRPLGVHLASVDPCQEVQMAADLIANCYPDIQPPAQVVFSWTQRPVFDPDLWIWVVDEETSAPVGLGIAEFDREISEASLEWIQVLPGYRSRGFGKLIVRELLDRLQKKARFVTVSGEADDETNPEALYRRCGFTGNDVWWVCRS